MKKGMATHVSILAWRIPRTEEPDELQSMGLQRVGQDQATNTFTFTKAQSLYLSLQISYPYTFGILQFRGEG